MRILALLVTAALLTGCANQKWQRYDSSQYAVSMEPGEGAYQEHVDFLLGWADSKDGLPVGLAAELGFYLALLGRGEEAEQWFNSEVEAFPESEKFIAALRTISLDTVDGGTALAEDSTPELAPDSQVAQ